MKNVEFNKQKREEKIKRLEKELEILKGENKKKWEKYVNFVKMKI